MFRSSSFSAELYKLRTHRTPWASLAVLLLGVVAPAAVMLFYTPGDPSAYAETYSAVFQLLGPIVAIAFGGWLLGTEFRQDTAKRMLVTESRRIKALTVKAVTGLVALAGALSLTAGVGWAAARVVGSMNDYAVPFEGRTLLAAGLFALGAALVSFALSAITRSDSFAMVGTLTLVLILDPLLGLIPRVGKYTFGGALSTLTDKVANTADGALLDPSALTTGQAAIALGVWFAAFLGTGGYLFAKRDL